ncbi:MAG TPA: cupredoxin domain-containing protein [Nitrosopumilaceae archaeon]|nr:cupredoxin domain-containing protein [Nitrosopumilaceae archaeon]
MGTSNALTVGMIVGIVIAIIMSGAALMMLFTVNEKISSIAAHEAVENLEVGAPGVGKNEFYIFTQELEADEEQLGVPVAVFTLTEIVVHKGDNITIHFINPAEEPDDRHTFTMQAPYEMNYDIAGGESTTFSFTADTVGTFTYYCTYDLPSMVGQLVVLP